MGEWSTYHAMPPFQKKAVGCLSGANYKMTKTKQKKKGGIVETDI